MTPASASAVPAALTLMVPVVFIIPLPLIPASALVFTTAVAILPSTSTQLAWIPPIAWVVSASALAV